MKLTTFEETLPVVQRVCVYGPPKSGKTQLVSQLAEHFNLIWFDLENGFSPLMKLPKEWQERIDMISIPDDRELPIAIETMQKVFTGAAGTICAKHGKWNCAICGKDVSQKPLMSKVCLNSCGPRDIVVIDSGTQLGNSAMWWVTRGKDDEYKPQRDDWGALKFVIERTYSKIQRAKYNIIVITHEDEVEMIDGKEKIVPVSGSRNSSRNTAKYFDHVVYCSMKNSKHVFGSATTYVNSVLTGSRLDVEIEKLEKPSLMPFFQHLLKFPLSGIQIPAIGETSGTATTGSMPNPPVTPVVSLVQEPTAATQPAQSTGSAALERLRMLKSKGRK